MCAAQAAACLELSKARLTAFVVLTVAVGYVLASPAQGADAALLWTLLGSALAAAGANALNEWLEAERDAVMPRTCRRPLPTRRISPAAALTFGLLTGLVGPVLLCVKVNAAAGALAMAALLLYVLLYTPLKVRTPLNTLVGAVVGAIPPLIGWVAAAGRLDVGAWLLAAILFAWQVPHFLAVAWLRRDEYARGGFRMLPVIDPHGQFAAGMIVLYTLLLLPLGVLLSLVGTCGLAFALGSLALGGALLATGLEIERRRSAAAARRVFVATLVYLPLLLGLMVLDRHPTAPRVCPTPRANRLVHVTRPELLAVGQAQYQSAGIKPAPRNVPASNSRAGR